MRIVTRAALCAALVFLQAGSAEAFQAPSERRLILISIDGLMPSTVENAEKLGLKIPNLREFRDRGTFAKGLRGVMPTVTYPSHTTMVTGVEPSEHGILANGLFDPEQRMNGSWFWYTEQIRKPVLWDVAKAAGLTTGAVLWPVTVGAKIDFNFPDYRAWDTPDDLMLYRALSTPGLVADLEKNSPAVAKRWDERAAPVEAARFLIRTRKPNLLLFHILDLDGAQHRHGPGSPQSLQVLERIDGYLALLRAEVSKAGLESSTQWIITSDHGFRAVKTSFQPHAFLASLGLAAPAGNPSGWRVAAHPNGGTVAFVVKDPADTEAQRRVLKTLQRLRDEGVWGIESVFLPADLEKMKGYSHAFVAVNMIPTQGSANERTGPWVISSGVKLGTHGFAPGPEEMDCSFIAFGPGIPARRLPRHELKDVANTAAAILGLRMPSATGKDLLSLRP